MITWMQRHRKYLVITIWISTIAFIGAGFVGWGQYSYGDKASAVAKVGDVTISGRELQQSYSRLYNQYSQMFQGNFDAEQAKSFGLENQALRQLINQALLLNLGESYGLRVTDAELLEELKTLDYFFKEGTFDKETYAQVLRQNNLTMAQFEEDMRKSLLIQKVMNIFAPKAAELEKEALENALYISDRLSIKILTPDMITINTSEEKLKAYWQNHQFEYMTLPAYKISAITQTPVDAKSSEAEIAEYYAANKFDFKDAEGAILELETARDAVIAALNDKATKKEALRTYSAYKKGKLDANVTVESLTINKQNSPYDAELFAEIEGLNTLSPFLKPRKNGDNYIVIKLEELIASVPMSFETAKVQVLNAYTAEQKQAKLQELAQNSVAAFKGDETPFLTREDVKAVPGLSETEATEFLNALFDKHNKRGHIALANQKVVLYDILEQKMLDKSKTDQENSVMRLKSTLLDQGLLKKLESRYAVEIFIEGR